MADMNKAAGNQVLLTGDDIRRWQDDLQRWEATKSKAEASIAELKAKLGAASLLFGADFPLPVSGGDVAEEGDQETFGDATKRIMATFPKAVLHQEVQAELRKIPRFREVLDRNGGAYYYTVVNRLVKRGEVKKFGKKIRLVQKNETPPEESPESVS